MRREGRLHGYEFDREESHRRVKASRQPTNRSKFRSKLPQEKAGRPRYKALCKIKGQRNKAHGSDVASNYKMQNWALHTGNATWLADSLEEPADMDPSQQAPLCDALRVLLLAKIEIRTQEIEDKTNKEEENEEEGEEEEEEEEADDKSYGSDWLDLGSTDRSDVDDDEDVHDDDWYLC